MSNIKRVVLFFIFVLFLANRSYAQSAEEIMDKSRKAVTEAQSVNAISSGKISVTSKAKNLSFKMDMEQRMLIDPKNKRALIKQKMSMPGQANMPISMDSEQYIINDAAYIKMMGKWIKSGDPRIIANIWEALNKAYVMKQGPELAAGGIKVELTAQEDINKEPCYVLEYKLLDNGKYTNYLKEQLHRGQPSGSDLSQIDAVKKINNFSNKMWISKVTFFPKMLYNVVDGIFIKKDKAGKEEEVDMSMENSMTFYDWGRPVNIVLPKEAEGAVDMGALMQQQPEGQSSPEAKMQEIK